MSETRKEFKGERIITGVLHEWQTTCDDIEAGKKSLARFELQKGKLAVDTERNSIRISIGRAKSGATLRGNFLPPATYRAMEEKEAALKILSQRIQMHIGEVGRNEKHLLSVEIKKKHDGTNDSFYKSFFRVAKKTMPRVEFERFCQIAEAAGMKDQGTQ